MTLVPPPAARVVLAPVFECNRQGHDRRVARMAAAVKRTVTESQRLPALIAFDLDGTLWCALALLRSDWLLATTSLD